MPRNVQGLYTLPLPPVNPGELVESDWANTTMDDLASALTASLPRDGSAPMTGALTLANVAPTNPLHATSKQYVDNFVAFSTGLPIGAVVSLATAAVPGGFLLCNGQAVSRVTYSVLFAAIGTTYGAGDGSTTFNVPDLRDYFIRGRGVARTLGSLQASALGTHNHAIIDPGHSHAGSQAAHSHTLTTGTHSHSLTDPGHLHTFPIGGGGSNPANGIPGNQNSAVVAQTGNTASATTGISIAAAAALTGTTNSLQPTITVSSAMTGVSTGPTGDVETRPQNIAFDFYIKALQDSAGPVAILSITSADTQMLTVDFSIPTSPQLVPHSNVAFGMVKLDASGRVPLAQMPFSATSLLGYFDASGGENPSQKYPAIVYVNGNQYIVSVGGNILVRDPVTGIESMTVVAVGSFLTYLFGSSTLPDGWYSTPAPATLPASSITFIPSGTISATDVQTAITELLGETLPLINNRITADFTTEFSSPTSLRVAFQTSTLNGNTNVSAIPNGTATTSSFQAYGSSDPSNASFIQITASPAFGDVRLVSGASGSGVFLPLVLITSSSVKFTVAADVTGTFTFGGSAPRIRGDFTNGPIANQVMWQTSIANGTTNLSIIPNGSATGTNFLAYNNANPTDAGFAGMSMNSTGAVFQSGRTGVGTYLPMFFYTTGVERARIATTGPHTGLGAAPNAGWGASIPAHQLGALASIYAAPTAAVIGQNIYNDGAGLRYSTAAVASSLTVGSSISTLSLYPTGVADAAVNPAVCTWAVNLTTAQFTASTANASAAMGCANTNAGANAFAQVYSQSNAGVFSMQKFSTAAGAYSFLTSTGGNVFIGSSDNFTLNLRANNVDTFQITPGGASLHINPLGGHGYGVGAGGSVTQLTSKSTAVTLNRPTGVVIMSSASLAAGATVQFALNNSLAGTNDCCSVNRAGSPLGGNNLAYQIWCETVVSGIIYINVKNLTAGALAEAVTIQFNLHKGAIA